MLSRLADLVAPVRFGGPFRWLLGSSWATNLGDGVAAAAGPLLIASVTDDPLLIALAALARWAPPLVFGLHAGVVSDRFDRRRVVLVANVARVVVLAGLVALLVGGAASATLVLTALTLLAIAEVFADNTTATLLPMLVARADLASANQRLQAGFITLNQLAGPAVGAALFAAGQVWPFLSQLVLVAAGILLVSRVRLPPHRPDPTTTGTVRRDIADGLRWLWRHPAVRTLALTILVFNVTYGAAWSVLVLYAGERLGLGAFGFGLLTTVSAAGGLIGTAVYGWITARVSLGNVMRIGLVIETVTHLALALTRTPWIAYGIFLVFGAHAFVWGTTSTTIRQRVVPTGFQGRVGSVYTMALFGGLVVGSALGGVLANRFGVTAPFWFAFVGSAVFVVVLWRQLRLIAHEDAEDAEDAARSESGDLAPSTRS